jgi:hypothetical protein
MRLDAENDDEADSSVVSRKMEVHHQAPFPQNVSKIRSTMDFERLISLCLQAIV